MMELCPLWHILGGDRTCPPIDAALPRKRPSRRAGAKWRDVPTAEVGLPSLAGPLDLRVKSLGQPLLAASDQPERAFRPNSEVRLCARRHETGGNPGKYGAASSDEKRNEITRKAPIVSKGPQCRDVEDEQQRRVEDNER
jgi:hypothetical protein